MNNERLSMSNEQATTEDELRVTSYDLRRTKRCSRCGEVKPADEFYRNRHKKYGLTSYCKQCILQAHKKRFKEQGAGIKARIRARRAHNPWPFRLRNLEYYARNRDRIIRRVKEYRRKNRKERLAYQRRYSAANPHKRKAHRMVRQALVLGEITREGCEICRFLGLPAEKRDAVAHHEDYDRPLEVRWLCRSHHTRLHAGHFSLLQAIGNRQLAIGETTDG